MNFLMDTTSMQDKIMLIRILLKEAKYYFKLNENAQLIFWVIWFNANADTKGISKLAKQIKWIHHEIRYKMKIANSNPTPLSGH